MSNPTTKRWNIVTHLSIGISLVSCLALGISGYWNFTSHVKGDILNNFDPTDRMINVARALLASTMVFTFPMEQYVARHSIISLSAGYGHRINLSLVQHVLLTLSLWGSSVFLGLCFEDVGIVLELTGAVAASMLGYFLPGAIYFAVERREWLQVQSQWRKASSSYEPDIVQRFKKSQQFIIPLVMICFGILAMLFGTLSAVLT